MSRELVSSLGLSFHGTSILLRSDQDIFDVDSLHQVSSLVTGMEVIPQENEINWDGMLTFYDDSRQRAIYDIQASELIIAGSWKRFENGVALSHSAGYLAECLRAVKRGSLLVHAAGVGNPDSSSSLIIFGEKGAGKTTTAIRLCQEYGFSLVGNDQIFVGVKEGNLISEGGDDHFNVRQTAIMSDSYLQNILSLDEKPESSSWNNKRQVRAKDLGVELAHDALSVNKVYHVRIDGTQQSFMAKTWTSIQRSLFLHEKIGRHITGQATPFMDDQGNYYGSLPPINVSESLATRDRITKTIIDLGIMELFSPDSQHVVDYITEVTS